LDISLIVHQVLP